MRVVDVARPVARGALHGPHRGDVIREGDKSLLTVRSGTRFTTGENSGARIARAGLYRGLRSGFVLLGPPSDQWLNQKRD